MEQIEKLIDCYRKETVELFTRDIIGDLTALVGYGMNLGGEYGEIYAEAVQECIRTIEKRKEMELNG